MLVLTTAWHTRRCSLPCRTHIGNNKKWREIGAHLRHAPRRSKYAFEGGVDDGAESGSLRRVNGESSERLNICC
jgi:hypothetical protein